MSAKDHPIRPRPWTCVVCGVVLPGDRQAGRCVDCMADEEWVPMLPPPTGIIEEEPRKGTTWRPASTTTALTDELSGIFGKITEPMVRKHISGAKARAERDGILTPAELAAVADKT